jgi:arylsulfatase A-like enzyme
MKRDVRIDRRTFLKDSLIAGVGLTGVGLAIAELAKPADAPNTALAQRAPRSARGRPSQPNILVIVVDQLRYPQWLALDATGAGLPPNLRALRQGAVSFAGHYTASNDCSPARSTLLTGLYTHQTGCLITGGSTLDHAFPTYGTLLREHGYRTWWYGKWHLTHGDNHWRRHAGRHSLERYGFAGGTYPSPDGAPGQGWRVDPRITRQFEDWFSHEGGSQPWCTTVSFVNPHDIAWWYRWSDRVPAETEAPSVATSLPPNFETPEAMIEREKPRLQRSLQQTAATSFGPVPFTGPEVTGAWLGMLDLYAKLQNDVDAQVGQVLSILRSNPAVAANTIIVFTSDHGEYAGSHGLRGKGAGAYEEAIKVPLLVKDLRGVLKSSPELARQQLTSSVDVAPLLLTLATGSGAWRAEPHYAHLARRADLAQMLADPRAPGRSRVLHATDETVTEFASEPYAADAPLHVVALRTQTAKYATYSNWSPQGADPLESGQEVELYDYATPDGRLELHNSAGQSRLESSLRASMGAALTDELREPLPGYLARAQRRGFADYASASERVAVRAEARRRDRLGGGPLQTTPSAPTAARARPARIRS